MRKKGFLSNDISNIAIGFQCMELHHLPEVVATAIGWALEDKKMQNFIIDSYLDHLSKKRSKKINE